ncbi:MAG: hypothetical protein NC131_17010 [Roseburia sp.]|nr:hypothetical protein [Roseburia sp.]
MKKQLLFLFPMLLLVGCAQEPATTPTTYAGESESVASPANESIGSIYDVKIGDKTYTVPFAVSELEGSGLTLQEATVDTVMRGADNIAYYVDENNGMVVVNLGTMEESCPINDATVIDILADTGNTETTILKVYGDVDFDTPKEDVAEVFGEPMYDDGHTTMYSIVDEDKYMDGVYVALEDDKVVRIEVLSADGYVDMEEEELEEFESTAAEE